MRLNIDLVFSLRSVFLTLVAIATFFIIFDSVVYSFSFLFATDFIKLVDITKESNLPTWFSSTQLLFVGICAYFIGNHRGLQKEKAKALAWFAIALFFAYMGIDDASRLHERVATIMGHAAKQSDSQAFFIDAIKNFPSYYWLLIFLPIFAGFGLFMTIFLFRECEQKQVMRLFLGGIACYAAAVGLDFFDGITRNYDPIVEHTLFSLNDARHLFRALEEFVEMIGTTFILVAFLQHWQRVQMCAASRSPGAG